MCTAGIGYWLLLPITGQRFSGEHLGSFLAGTRILEKKRRVFLGVYFEVVTCDGSETGPTWGRGTSCLK
jgi:hypothetical protein